MFVTKALALISISYDNTELTKLMSEIWEHDNITTTKSDGARNTSSQATRFQARQQCSYVI